MPLFLRYISVIAILMMAEPSYAQQVSKEKALNTYIEFLNESVHGLTVAHILFVNYNKDLNKYVDLDSHKINAFMTNQEVGSSIFDNPDISTSDNNTSALQLSKITEQRSQVLNSGEASRYNKLVFDIVQVLNNINSLRFKIETFIASSDLNEKENIYKSYEMLEQAVSYFKSYTAKHDQLVQGLRKNYNNGSDPVGKHFDEVYDGMSALIADLKKDNNSRLDGYVGSIVSGFDQLTNVDVSLNGKQKKLLSEIIDQGKLMALFTTQQINSPNIPDSYFLYGPYYYLHNHVLLSYINSISPGFISKMNNFMSSQDKPYMAYDDKPIIFKVTYPEKMQEIESIATKNAEPLSLELPVKVKMEIDDSYAEVTPEVEIPKEPQQDYVELEFFDPDLLDRDSISVSWNDEWILTDHKLESTSEKIRFDIDPQKGNSIFILAKNTGIISPNTVGFKYRFNGKGKKTYIKKYLEPNQGYELILTIDGLGGFSDK